MSNCDLCKLVFENDIKTELIAQTEYWLLTRCVKDGLKMAVLKRHATTLTLNEYKDLIALWEAYCPTANIRTQARKIHDHIHFHFVEA